MNKNFLKIYIICSIVCIVLALNGCSCYQTNGIDYELISYVKKLVRHPEQISHLKEIKDEYYNDSCFYKQLKDSSYCYELIDFIKNEYSKDSGCERILRHIVFLNDSSLNKMNEGNYYREQQKYALQDIKSQTKLKDISISDFIEFELVKSKYGVGLLFYINKNNNKIFLCNIGKAIFPNN